MAKDEELIEKLKDKDQAKALGRHSQDTREIFEKAGPKNCLCYTMAGWKQPTQFFMQLEYILKPDYQPEPEYVDLEITNTGRWLGVVIGIGDALNLSDDNSIPYYPFIRLHCLVSLPNFEYFWLKTQASDITISFERVAKKRSEGKKVYARFRGKK